MVRRAKAKKVRRKSPRTRSLWNLAVGWTYLTGLSKMATGYGPIGFVLGPDNLMESLE